MTGARRSRARTRQERRRAQRRERKQGREKTVPPPPRGFARPQVLSVAALILMTAAAYYPVVDAGFVWDDEIVTGAEAVRSPSGLERIWFSPGAIEREGHYWPLLYTTFWLEHKLWGFAPAGYHLVNVLLHLVNTLLLWRILGRLAVPAAWFAAALFALHPLHVESVAWIIERKDMLSGLFYLAAALAYVRFQEKPGALRYLLPLALFAAALLSKSIAVTLPAALLILHWWKQDRVRARDCLRLLPFFALGLGMVLADLAFYRSREVLVLDYSMVERALIAARALWFYAGKLLWPVDLAVIYPLWDVSAADPLAWSWFAAALALPAALYGLRRRIGRGPLAGAAFFAVTLSPVLGFVDYGYMQYAFAADRFQYLAGAGVTTVIAAAAARAAVRLPRAAAAGVAGAVLLALGILTWRQAGVWRDNVTLNSHILGLNPRARGAHHNLGKGLLDRGRPQESIAATRVALERHPVLSGLDLDPGAALLVEDLGGETAGQLRRAAALDPSYAEVHVNLALAFTELGRLQEAERHLRHVVYLDPRHERAHVNLGRALLDQGRLQESIAATRVALGQRPNSIEANVNLGAALLGQGRPEEAERHLRGALQHNPGDANILQNLAEGLRMQGRYEEALPYYAAAIENDPDLAMAHAGQGDTLFRLQRYAAALRSLERAVALQPGTPVARSLLVLMGKAAEALGQSAAAARYFERAAGTRAPGMETDR